jgi:AsmA family protein
MRSILKWAGITVAVLIFVSVLLAIFFDWNWLRVPVSSMVSKVLDRRFAIHGDLAVDVSMTPRITANQIELANTSWGSRPEMLNLDRLEFSIRLKNLLDRQVVLPEIHLSKPQLILEKNAGDKTNWTFKSTEKEKQGKQTGFPKIGLLTIDNGKLFYRDPRTEADLVVSTSRDTSRRQVIEVRGQGLFEKAKLTVQVTAGSLLSLRERLEPYPIDIEVVFGNTKVTAKGTLRDPVQFQGPDLIYAVQGSDLSDFYPVIGVSLPKTPPYNLSGHLTSEGKRWILSDLQGFVGSSDLSGNIDYTTREERPFLQADLVSKKLDFKDLAGFLGAKPTQEKVERKRIFPDTPYDLKALRTGDADVKFQSKNIITPDLPIDELVAHLQLDHGKLHLSPLNFGIDIGKITSNITLDAQQAKIATKADFEIRKVPFKRLLADTRFAKQSEGSFLGRANLAASGNSVAEMLGYADGDVAIIMENGRISNLLVDLIDLDIAKSLTLELTKDLSIPIRCIIASFSVNKGLMRAEPLVVDTTKSNIVGQGEINLRDETLNLILTAHPKTPSVLSARAPLIVKGTFKDPDVYPDPKYLAAKATASAVLGALLTPAAAIIPWIELGLGKDSECQTLIAAAKENSAIVPQNKEK